MNKQTKKEQEAIEILTKKGYKIEEPSQEGNIKGDPIVDFK